MDENNTVNQNKKPEFRDSGFKCSAKNKIKVTPNLAEPDISINPDSVMPKKTPPYSRHPHSLKHDNLFYKLKAKHKWLFTTLIKYANYKPEKFNIHGEVVELQIGQFCTTLRELAKLCGEDFHYNNDVARGLTLLEKCGFLRLELRQRKTIITITHEDTYSLMVEQAEARFETKLRQKRDIKEERKKEKKEDQSARSVHFSYQTNKFEGLSDSYLCLLKETFPGVDVVQQMREMRLWLIGHSNLKRVGGHAFITGWLKKSPATQKVHVDQEQEFQSPKGLAEAIKRRDEQCKTK